MRHIQKKSPPPASLRAWLVRKKKQFVSKPASYQWDQFQKSSAPKHDLQERLLQEQGHLCAYCNRRIHKGAPEDDVQMRMDHLYPKHRHLDKLFDYHNIVGSCYGSEKDPPPKDLHCEGLKRFKDNSGEQLPEALFPTDPRCERYKVTEQGQLIWQDGAVQSEMETWLNLNCIKLVNNRMNVLQPYIDLVDDEGADLETEVHLTLTPDPDGRMEAYAGVIVAFLRQYV